MASLVPMLVLTAFAPLQCYRTALASISYPVPYQHVLRTCGWAGVPAHPLLQCLRIALPFGHVVVRCCTVHWSFTMAYAVIFFTASGSIGQKDFQSFAEAEAFEAQCLAAGHTTSGVLSAE